MIFSLESKVVLEMEHTPGAKTSVHRGTKFSLNVSKNIDKSQYLDSEDLPTAVGTKSLTIVLVQGLIGNIHNGHQKGYWDSAEHLRYIISELQRGFVEVATINKDTF